MLLENKNAVIYGGGSVGSAVARAFARDGARVFLAGQTLEIMSQVPSRGPSGSYAGLTRLR